MQRTYEKQLPRGYRPVLTVDAKDKKTMVMLNAAALVIAIVLIALGFLIFRNIDFTGGAFIVKYIAFILAMLVYIVLHELTHGAAYKLLTHQKLTFGMNLKSGVAYCGVPDIYVYRRTALISLFAPFTVFSVLFLALAFTLTGVSGFLCWILFAVHFSGCAGDLYDACLLFTKLKDKRILMNDNGPRQIFYAPENN